jgi:hypothetical protein
MASVLDKRAHGVHSILVAGLFGLSKRGAVNDNDAPTAVQHRTLCNSAVPSLVGQFRLRLAVALLWP